MLTNILNLNILIYFAEYNRAAVQECPSEESDPDDHLRAEQRQKNLDAKHANIRELIGMCLKQRLFTLINSIINRLSFKMRFINKSPYCIRASLCITFIFLFMPLLPKCFCHLHTKCAQE